MKLIIASSNAGKIREFREMLTPLGFDEVLSMKEAGVFEEPEETGTTFEENAAIKAEAIFRRFPDCAALADDSGLEVDALGGEPGVYSARYKGLATDTEKMDSILKALENTPESERGARFVCAICLITPQGRVTARGVCEGRIGYEKRGQNGFGYDPIFMHGDRSFAELCDEEKNALSHRGAALRLLEARILEARG